MKVEKQRAGGQQILTSIQTRICELFGAEQGAKIHSYVKLLIRTEISSQDLRSKLAEFFQNKSPGELDSFIDFMEIVTHESEEKEELQKLEKAFNEATSQGPRHLLAQEEDKGISLKEVSAGKKVISLRGVGHSERRIAPLKAAPSFTSDAARKMVNKALTAAATTTNKSPASDLPQEPAYSYPEEDVMSLNSYRAERGAIGAPFQIKRKQQVSREDVLSRLSLAGGKRKPIPQNKSSSGSLSQFKYVRKSQSPPKKEKFLAPRQDLSDRRKWNEGVQREIKKNPLEEVRQPEGGVISLNKRNNQIREKKEQEEVKEQPQQQAESEVVRVRGGRGGRGGRGSYINPYMLSTMMMMDPFMGGGASMGRARKDKTYIPPTSKYYRGRGTGARGGA